MDWFLYDNGLCHERVKEHVLHNFTEYFSSARVNQIANVLIVTRLIFAIC